MSSQHTTQIWEKGCLANPWFMMNVGRTQSCLVTACAADRTFLCSCQIEKAASIMLDSVRQLFTFFDKVI